MFSEVDKKCYILEPRKEIPLAALSVPAHFPAFPTNRLAQCFSNCGPRTTSGPRGFALVVLLD
jgi:hypothetical protein